MSEVAYFHRSIFSIMLGRGGTVHLVEPKVRDF
jgi:hypothetical protein